MTQAPEDLYQMTMDPQKAPDVPTILVIEFKKGKYFTLVSCDACVCITSCKGLKNIFTGDSSKCTV